MSKQDLVRRTQFEHIVKYPLLSVIMKEVTSIESFYGEHITQEKILDDLHERLGEKEDMTIDNYIDVAAVAIVSAKLADKQ